MLKPWDECSKIWQKASIISDSFLKIKQVLGENVLKKKINQNGLSNEAL